MIIKFDNFLNESFDIKNPFFIRAINIDEYQKIKNFLDKLGYINDSYDDITENMIQDESYYPFDVIIDKIDLKYCLWTIDPYNQPTDDDLADYNIYHSVYEFFEDRLALSYITKRGLPIVPNYSPKTIIRENKEERYPYRFKTEKEFVEEFGQEWLGTNYYSPRDAKFTWIRELMHHLYGKQYPYHIKNLNDDLKMAYNFYVDKWMLTRNTPTTPSYRPRNIVR